MMKGDNDKANADFMEVMRLQLSLMDTFHRGTDALGRKEFDQAIADFTEAIRLDPNLAIAYINRGLSYASQGKHDKAIADFTEAIHLNPESNDPHPGGQECIALLELAWLLATTPKDELRNSKKALEYATKTCALYQWNNANALDTLAAAYAEDGQFQEAVKWQKKALEDSMFENTFGDEARQRLTMYEHGKPYRQGHPDSSFFDDNTDGNKGAGG